MHCWRQIGAAIKRSKASLAVVENAGGFQRITQLLQWAALTFPGTPSPPRAQYMQGHLTTQRSAGLAMEAATPTSPTSAATSGRKPEHRALQPTKQPCTSSHNSDEASERSGNIASTSGRVSSQQGKPVHVSGQGRQHRHDSWVDPPGPHPGVQVTELFAVLESWLGLDGAHPHLGDPRRKTWERCVHCM